MLKCVPLCTHSRSSSSSSSSSISSTEDFFQFCLKPSITLLNFVLLDKGSVTPNLLAYFGLFTLHYPVHYFNCSRLVQKLVVITASVGIGATRTATFADA